MEYNNKHLLFAVLDWGLGHATRSLPLIDILIQQGYRITLASCPRVLDFLHSHYPQTGLLELPSYNVQYRWNNMAMNIAMKAPDLIQALKEERSIIREQHSKTPFDAIISDARYGCFMPNLPSFFITHQVHIKARKKLTDTMANKVHRQWMKNFDEIWVPDVAELPGIGGELSHAAMQQQRFYLGPTSRFQTAVQKEESPSYDWLFLLSGPEPARSQLEQRLLYLAQSYPKQKFVMIRAHDADRSDSSPADHVHIMDYTNSDHLESLARQSKQLLCRSGYSTLMDLSAWQTPAVLVPTPGQPEQLYLADHISRHYHWPISMQSELDDLPSFEAMQDARPLPPANQKENQRVLLERLKAHGLN
jgi:predicted glycosyltransferase